MATLSLNQDLLVLGTAFGAGVLTFGFAIVVALFWARSRQQTVHGGTPEQTRRALLENVAQNVSEVHHVYQQFLTLAMDYARHGADWPTARKEELRRVTDDLVAVFRHLTEAEATLLLLGEKKLERALRVYGAKIVHLRRQVYADRRTFSGEDMQGLDQLRQDIAEWRETFFDALSNRFRLAA